MYNDHFNFHLSPVSSPAASTGLDCGEPFYLRKIDTTTMAKTDKTRFANFEMIQTITVNSIDILRKSLIVFFQNHSSSFHLSYYHKCEPWTIKKHTMLMESLFQGSLLPLHGQWVHGQIQNRTKHHLFGYYSTFWSIIMRATILAISWQFVVTEEIMTTSNRERYNHSVTNFYLFYILTNLLNNAHKLMSQNHRPGEEFSNCMGRFTVLR